MRLLRIPVVAALASLPLAALPAEAPAPLATGAQSAAPALAPTVAQRSAEPKVQHLVIEDDAVRIDELRVRGQTQRISVHPKNSAMRDYEIVPATRGRDLSQPRDSVGQRVWSILSF